jgi:hypothetical protein
VSLGEKRNRLFNAAGTLVLQVVSTLSKAEDNEVAMREVRLGG